MTMRMMPPASGLNPSICVNGRNYSCALSAVIDVPDCDGFIMSANGWTEAANGGGSGATAARPNAVTAGKGTPFFDTTLGKVIRSDGKIWRDPNNGAAA
jgi:hypothetical protein